MLVIEILLEKKRTDFNNAIIQCAEKRMAGSRKGSWRMCGILCKLSHIVVLFEQ